MSTFTKLLFRLMMMSVGFIFMMMLITLMFVNLLFYDF